MMFIFLITSIIILFLTIIICFYFKKHDIEYYIINYVYVKNGEINFASDLRFCKVHKCYEQRDIMNLNKWTSVIIKSNLIKYKNFYFVDKNILQEFKQLEKKFPVKYYNKKSYIGSRYNPEFNLNL